MSGRRLGWLAGTVLGAAAIAGLLAGRSRRPERPPAGETARVRDLYERDALHYDSFIRVPERLLFGGGRAWAASQASGDVLEIAAGTGRNLPFYPTGLRIAGQDISRAMLGVARDRARRLRRRVQLHVGDAQALAVPDARFDSVVSTLALCTVPDERRALQEAWRVLRPGGRLVLLEHVRSPNPFVRALQRLFEPLAIRCAGDHLVRDPLDHLSAIGFQVVFCARSRAGLVERAIAIKPKSAEACGEPA